MTAIEKKTLVTSSSTNIFIAINMYKTYLRKLKKSSRFHVDGNVTRTQTVFHGASIRSVCIINSKVRLSLVTFLIRASKSLKNSVAFHRERQRWWLSYFNRFHACCHNSRSGNCLVEMTWSQRIPHETLTLLPWHHRYTIRSLSLWSGQWRDETSTVASALLTRSLSALCRRWRPADFTQLNLCTPDESTVAPQMQVWGANAGAPIRNATAILDVTSSRRVPTEEHGSACRNAPE
jgi:hypothetical protein